MAPSVNVLLSTTLDSTRMRVKKQSTKLYNFAFEELVLASLLELLTITRYSSFWPSETVISDLIYQRIGTFKY